MALYKYHYIELDTKRSPRISLQNIVAGETGNRLWITVTNNGETVDMSEKENDAWKYRVCLRIDSDLGTRRQDSAEANSGITFIDANTGDHGKINILLSKDSFTAGMNRAVLEIYSKRVNDNDTLICSAELTFRAAKNPTGENAGTVYPSLIKYENDLRQLVSDAEDAIDACEDATEAANEAARDAGHAAQNATIAANSANTAAQNADAKAAEAESAASAASTAAETLNTMLLNIDNTPLIGSNNLVKSGGVYDAIEAVSEEIPFNYVPITAEEWDDETLRCFVDEPQAEFYTRANGHALIISFLNPSGEPVSLYEYYRNTAINPTMIFFSSPKSESGVYYIADIDEMAITITRIVEHIPAKATVTNGVVTFADRNNRSLFTFTLPVYNGGVS